MDNNASYYLNVEQLLDVNGQTIEQIPTSDPVKATGRYENIDYEAIPKLDNFKQPQLNGPCGSVQYSYLLPINDSQSAPTQNSTMTSGKVILQDEQIYEDPGHIKEEIYEWLKQRNICKLDKHNVR